MNKEILVWRRQLRKCTTTVEIQDFIASMRAPGNCSHEAYMVCLSLAAVDYAILLKEEEKK